VPVTINNNSSILLDRFVTWISSALPLLTKIFIMIIIILGAIYPFIKGTWNRNTVETIFSLFKKFWGVIIGVLLIFNIGPSWLLNEQTGMYVLGSVAK
jgi:nucleoside recognition membrane protein YjiH